jgi:uroporphyrinogen decarboxylase
MNPKQRFLDALNFKQPKDVAAFMELEFHIYEEYIGKRPIVGFEFEALTPAEKEKALLNNAEIMVETAEKAGHDAIKDITGFWEVAPGEPAYLWLRDDKARLDQIRALKKVGGDKYFIIGSVSAPAGIPDGNNLYEFVIAMYERPDEVKGNNKKLLDRAVEFQKRMIDAGADGIINTADVAFNNGPFISPAQMDEFFFPYFYKWVESLKSQGVPAIWHTDGNLMPIMDRILESGVSAIQCVDPLGGMDIINLKKQVYGKLALIGNIDCSLLQFGPGEKIEEQVKTIIEGCKAGGGFILSGCNAIFKGISAENYQVMVDARSKYGRS